MLKLCIYMHRPQGLEGKLPRHCDWQSILGGFGHDLFKSDVSSAQGSQVRTDTLRQTLHWVPQPMPKPMGCAREIRSPGGREAWAKQLKLAKESILILSFVSFVQLSLPIPNKMGWNPPLSDDPWMENKKLQPPTGGLSRTAGIPPTPRSQRQPLPAPLLPGFVGRTCAWWSWRNRKGNLGFMWFTTRRCGLYI